MRIRYKKWARPELEACNFYRDNPEELKGKWKEEFENKNLPFHLELRMWKRKLYFEFSCYESKR